MTDQKVPLIADYVAQPRLTIVPLTLRAANDFVTLLHRHHKKATGHKFSIGVEADGTLVGVAIGGRPVSRHLDDGRTLEVNRTCTDGTDNANSCLYGAAWRTAKGMGYRCAITYTQEGESGASLRAAGWRILRVLPARASWAESSVKLKAKRDPVGNGGVARTLWGIGDCSHIVPDGSWVHCTPEFIHSGGDCANTPRRPCECPFDGSHDHFVTLLQRDGPESMES